MAEGYQTIVNATFEHAVDLELLSNTQARRLIVDINILRKELKEKLRLLDPTNQVRIATKRKRLDEYLKLADKTIDSAYSKIGKAQLQYLDGVAETEEKATKSIINDSLGDPVIRTGIDSAQLTLIPKEVLADGLPPDAWFKKKLPTDLKQALVRGLNTGIAQNETIQQLTSRINKTVDINRNHVETLVRTTTNAVSNKTRDAVYTANDDVIEGEEHFATLDTKTSPICRDRDGLAWTVPDHKPIGGHGRSWRPFPLHFNERSTWMPVFRNIDDITGVDTSNWGPGTRQAMDGPNIATENYSQWFAKQTESRQLEVLGPTKLSMYKKNNLSMRDMTKADGSSLTITQLQEKIDKKGFKPKPEVVKIPDKILPVTTIKTIEDAENALLGTGLKMVDLKRMDTSHAVAVSEQYLKLNKKYDNHNLIGLKAATIDNGVRGRVTREWDIVESTMKLSTIESKKEIDGIKALSKNGFSAKISPDKFEQYVVTHEYGHSLYSMKHHDAFPLLYTDREYQFRNRLKQLNKSYKNDVTRTIKRFEDGKITLEKKNKILRKIKISDYSQSNIEEWMAEGFAEFELSKNPSKYSRRIGNLITEFWGKK